MNLSSIFKDSLALKHDGFVKILESATRMLREESGRMGNWEISGRLLKLEPFGEALVVGDLHGDLESLNRILRDCRFTQKMAKDKDAKLIFLGDYGDRGAYSAEVYYTVLRLKLAFPEQVILMRGNHEGPPDLMAYPHDLPIQLQHRFNENWRLTYAKTRELWNYLYNAVLVDERCLMVHGGLPPDIQSAQDLALEEFLEDLLWSDPDDLVAVANPSPRGAGHLFGKRVTENVLRKLGVRILIRGHEPCREGFMINHEGRVLTLFSRKGAPYFNQHGSYLDFPLEEKFENATQLLPFIHKF